MSLVFETIPTPGIAVLSYLVGDDSEGTACLVDPCADVDRYVELARKKRVAITHIFETHIHADLISGSRELRQRLGAETLICVSCEGGASYDFTHKALKDGDRFEFGTVSLTAKHTPGHTPEHMSYLLHDKKHPDVPWGVLTGDSLFVNSAGRPDLLGDDQSEKLAAQQFHTLRDFYLKLDDSVIIYPAHGHGSPCGADIGERLSSTIGYERRFNEYLQFTDVKAFTSHALDSAPPVPTYYPRMKKVNAKGPKVLGNLPQIQALPAKAFQEAVKSGKNVLVDTRDMLAFGGGHIAGALNIGATPMLSLWAGWLLEPDQPVLLVADESKLDEVLALFTRTGYNHFAGYLVGGMGAWDNAGFPIDHVGEMTVSDVKAAGSKLQIVDVRSPGEWKQGHIPGAVHAFLPKLREQIGKLQLDANQPTAVYCATGYRASIGASILKQLGFRTVSNIPGSWTAWQKMGYPVAKEEEKQAVTR